MVAVDDKNSPLEAELLTEGGEAMIVINLKRLNRGSSQKVLISHFPKPKECGYFLIVGNPSKNDILAMKRVSFNRFITKNLSIALPKNFRQEKLELHLMSDSYIGLDQYHHIDLMNINALLESKGAVAKSPSASNAFTAYKSLQQEILDDIFDDDEANQVLATKAHTTLDQDDVGAKIFSK